MPLFAKLKKKNKIDPDFLYFHLDHMFPINVLNLQRQLDCHTVNNFQFNMNSIFTFIIFGIYYY